MKINKQVAGGFFGENKECKQNDSLQILAKKYVDNKKNRLNGLGRAMRENNVIKALKILKPYNSKNEIDRENHGYSEDISRSKAVRNCSDKTRLKIFYMLALKEATHRGGNHDYKPYFDVLFKDVEESEKQTAMKLLNDKFQFNIKESETEEPQPDEPQPDEPQTEGPQTEGEPQEEEGAMFTDSEKTDSEMTDSTDTGGGTRKYTKNLCHKKSVKKPKKCKKVKGCKVAKGTKRSYCRKAKNSTKSKKK